MKEREIEVDLGEVFSEIIKKWYAIIITAIIFGAVTYGVTNFLIQPKYQATTTLIVGNRNEDSTNKDPNIQYNEVLTNQRLVETYSEIMKSRSIAEMVIENLGLNMDVEDFSDMLTIETVNDTEVFSLTVEDTIPERARDIANETSEIFRDSITNIMKVDNVQILDPAKTPEEQSSPKVLKSTIIMAALGALLSMVFIGVRYTTDNTVKSSKQIQEEFDLPVLSSIPKVKKGDKINGKEEA